MVDESLDEFERCRYLLARSNLTQLTSVFYLYTHNILKYINE